MLVRPKVAVSGLVTAAGLSAVLVLAAEVATPFAAWVAFTASYLAIVAIEPLVTYGVLRLLKRYEDRPLVAICFSVASLRLA